ncbi:MAG: lipoate--protein ligase family protein [Deltaproteobacteria bacterium]|nr:lipoate--protein ligase family protein [Deltaproteobacteria bacterium]
MSENWRLILDPLLDGRENMAVDEAVLTSSDGSREFTPTLRLYGWSGPTLSIGYHQDAAGFSDCGLPVVRRVTGGRAVLHDSEITYSIVAPTAHPLFSGGITTAYFEISRCILSALRDAGINASMSGRAAKTRPSDGAGQACFSAPSRHELLVNGQKIAGSAQRRFKSAFLQHGSILFSIAEELNGRIFGRGLQGAMTCISAHSAVTAAEMRGLLVKGFSAGLEAKFQTVKLSGAEEYIKDGLMESRYSTPEWTSGAIDRTRRIRGLDAYGR